MADVATKNKSIVSNNTVNNLGKTKISDAVCGVQSNNGLIELDHNGHTTTTNATNNKLTLRSTSPTNDDDNEDDDEEDDDLILANNTRNELDSQDDSKSLQELIESELALRICANSNDSDATEDDETSEMSLNHQPEITKKIILEPRREEPVLDVNADFIVNEIDHYTLIREPYPYSNGHITPETNGTSHKVNGDQLIDDDEEAGDLHTETTETEVTTTTSGPSLPSAYEATPDVVPQVVENGHQHEQVEEVPSVNTLSDSCVDTTEEDTSKALSNKSVISAEDKDDTENLSEDQLNKSEDEEDSVKIYDNVDEQSYQKSSDYAAALSNNSFIENKGHNGLEVLQEEPSLSLKEASGIDEKACSFYATDGSNGLTNNDDRPTPDITDYKLKEEPEENGWITVAEVNQKSRNDDSLQEKTSSEMFYSQESSENYLDKSRLDDAEKSERSLAPIATPDEISDISNANDDSESREEVITTSSVVSTTTKKKKKIAEGSPGSDASPNHTKTKKTKKSKKSELEKENISVKKKIKSKETKESMHTGPRQSSGEMIEISAEDDLSNVNVKSLTQTYVTETSRVETEKSNKEIIATGVSIKQLCRSFGDVSNMNEGDRQSLNSTDNNRFQEKSSFNKFDALSKKSSQVLHVRSVDASKVQQQLNSIPNGDANPNCRSCGKVVFQMEQTKAEGMVWHKNCFRCVQCSKQLMVDNYESHEATLYCKPHFKELFQPKPVEESDQPTSDKPDLGLEELSSLNVKSRFQVFEKSNENVNEIERSPSQVAVKRSPSILSKLAKFQAKGMDIGVTDESLNGIPFEESSESEEEIEEEETEEVESETTIVKAKRGCRERPISFSKMDDIKNRWESTSQQGRRESQREARKEEMAGIRSRLFMGKQGKMKEMYQQAVADSEKITKVNAAEEIQHTTNARSIKERFERGEPIAPTSDDEQQQEKQNKGDKPDEEILAAGISRKSRSLFLEMDATAAKTGRPVTPNSQAKTPVESPRRARDMESPDREIFRDPEVVRADDRGEEVVRTDTARKMLSIFRQMEENATKEDLPDGPKPLKRFTPPPEDKFAKATASETDDEEDEAEESEDEEHNPNYVRASDKVEDEFLKQAQNAARAKTLRAKFEHWEETTDGKTTQQQHVEMDIAQTDGSQPSIESASSLRARFESLGSQPAEAPRAAKVKVNRFVEIQTNCMDVCESCEKKVYPLEKVETNNKIFHKQCFRCLQCNAILRMDTFTLNNGKLYCIPHFKQLFITRGNYDEGFGVDPHKNKWATAAPAAIAVRNGDV